MDYTNDSKNSIHKPDDSFVNLKHFDFKDMDNNRDNITDISLDRFEFEDETENSTFKESNSEYDIYFVPLEKIDFDKTSDFPNDFDVSLDKFKFDDEDDVSDFLTELISDNVAPSNKKDLDKISKKEKKLSKKRKKKKKKGRLRLNQELLMFHAEDNFNAGAFISQLIKDTDHFVVKDKKLYIYNEELGCYEICNEDDFSIKLNSLLNEDIAVKIKTSEYKEAYRQMCISHELITDKGFFENGPFVNCLNGVVDVINRRLLPHSPTYRFKHCIHANYIPDDKTCPKYLGYIDLITALDNDLKALIRAIHGYMFSHYNNAKIAIIVISKSHTGKSVMCNIMERIIGPDDVAHADLALLPKQEYAAHLSGKLANIVPDLKNIPLKDVGFFKSLVSHNDTIATRALYQNPGNVRGETKMFFSSNHPIQFDKSVDEGDVVAVFNRLLYFPFQNKPITETEENKNFSEEIFDERDAIFTWAMEGLREYILNNEIFPKSERSEQMKNKNYSMYCPEKVFFDNCIKEKKDSYESATAIKEAFFNFCSRSNITTQASITNYIKNRLGIAKVRKRIDKNGNICKDGNPINVYPGIKLKKNATDFYFDITEF